ncbi:F-box/WD repeat protein Pop2 [Schizosaccharomyces cryophilus OY26]|uniref:F-box/WD repeat protein Pop2 n=1 Tax=Schizosaccharomyces cryophilus (strain OY26 / ATCC MYA-4695 / CBS 11777 / NBRC 106824 / NRRL Y48691) TaxID=653667 RepID=S9X7R8_SCHCR|nr:F-box/WD repeat protein Pop2 [Schizosaccharomyces cryophilus OY26]EPY53172.1 F-box/WD repeat protein Pop2 [Schizosaccharomyces cryophilus OY26]
MSFNYFTESSSVNTNDSLSLMNSNPATPPEPSDSSVLSERFQDSSIVSAQRRNRSRYEQYPLRQSALPDSLKQFNVNSEDVSYRFYDMTSSQDVREFDVALVPQRNLLSSSPSALSERLTVSHRKRICRRNDVSSAPNSYGIPPSPKVDASLTPINQRRSAFCSSSQPEPLNLMSIAEKYQSLPENIQAYTFFQLLRSCDRQNMRPLMNKCELLLKKDLLAHLPEFIVREILGYLDIQSFLTVPLVHKKWKNIFMSFTLYWKLQFKESGFSVDIQDWKYAYPLKTPPPFLHNDHIADEYYYEIFKRHYVKKQRWISPAIPPSHLSFPVHDSDRMITFLRIHNDKIVISSESGSIQIHSAVTGALETRLDGHKDGVWAVQIYGNTLVSGSLDKTIRVWNMKTGECTHIFRGHTSTIRCLEILTPKRVFRDGKVVIEPSRPYIVSGSRDHTLRVWKFPEENDPRYLPSESTSIEQWEKNPYYVHTLLGHTESVRCISGYGDILVSGSYDYSIRVWRISTGECLCHLRGHTLRVYSVLYEPEKNLCISSSMDKTVKVWDLRTRACLYTLEGHSLPVTLLNIVQDKLISGSADSTIRIWDLKSGIQQMVMYANGGYIRTLQADEHKIVSSNDGSLKLWDIKTGKLLKFLLTDVSGIWQVHYDDNRCVAAVQRENQAYLEVVNFFGRDS